MSGCRNGVALTLALSSVKSFPKRLCGVATSASSPNWTEGSKVLRLIDYLDKTCSKSLQKHTHYGVDES
jgi:hypothetical protein